MATAALLRAPTPHQGTPHGVALAEAPARASSETQQGHVVGTPHYMAPEQAMGERDITARADIYALGCVTYDMLTAEPPFQGATAQAIIARVMTEEPRSLTLQRKTIPPHVEAAVITALSKLPADRFASAAQFAAALVNPGYTSNALHRSAMTAARPTPRARLIMAAPWVLLAIVSLLAVWQRFGRPAPAPAPIFRLGLETSLPWEDQTGSGMALSPDGTTLVYNGRDSTGSRLFLRRLDRPDPVPISGATGALTPFFSPDGRRIGFQVSGKLFQVSTAGGAAESICPGLGTSLIRGVTWLDLTTVVVADSGGLRQCSAAGAVTLFYRPPDSLGQVAWPHALPGGRAVLYTLRQGATFRIGVYDVRRHDGHLLNINGSNPRYVASGYLLYATLDGILHAVPFDADKLQVTGEPVKVMEGVRVGGGGAAKMALASNGTMVTTRGQSGQQVLELVSRQGLGERLPAPVQTYLHPRLSPDGRQVAVGVGTIEYTANIWLLDRRQGTLTRLTFDSGATRPSWSPDGRRIVYSRLHGGDTELRIVDADGSAPAESLLTIPGLQLGQNPFTPDGRTLIVRGIGGRTGRDIWRVRLDSTRALTPLLHGPADEQMPILSPDGRWMGYVSDESGRQEVYVRSFPGMGARYQISLDGGTEPVWSPRGGEIFYRNGPAMLVAAVRTAPGFEVLGRTTLFTSNNYINSGGYDATYDVTADGQHLLMVRGLAVTSSMTLTLNWFDNLRAGRVGGDSRAPEGASQP